jgi:hypothetical protein
MRVISLLFLMVVACGSDSNVAAEDLSRADLAVCTAHLDSTSSTQCGTKSCKAGEICVADTPGSPNDGGPEFLSQRCEPLPPSCQTCAACGDGAGAFAGPVGGCFAELCKYSINCKFDGAMLTCIGI